MITRKEAIERGEKFYFTGKPCKNGHISNRYTKHMTCIQCLKDRASTDEAKEKMRNHNKMRRKNPDYLALEKKIRNKESAKKRKIEYNKTEKMKSWRREYQKTRSKTDKLYLVARRTSGLIRSSFSRMGFKKGTKTELILCCDWNTFKKHIEKQFSRKMRWDNYGEWELDHIIPVASAKSESDVISLNHFTNLRPIWANKNREKSDKREFLI